MSGPCSLLSLFVLPFLLCACKEEEALSKPAADGIAEEAPAAWSYDGETGPEHWDELSSDYADCDGGRQSPIDLADARPPNGAPHLQTAYATAEATVVDTGHAVQVNTEGGTLDVRDKTYVLEQLHVHTPSEHTLQGERYAAEIHLVHQSDDQYAVLTTLVEEGAPHPHLDEWVGEVGTTIAYNAGWLLPERRSYYTYEGSLTTPPCTEGVRWVIFDTPIQASSEQLDALRARHDDNVRPLQSRNGRALVRVAP